MSGVQVISAGVGPLGSSGLGLEPHFMQQGSSIELRMDPGPVRCLTNGVTGAGEGAGDSACNVHVYLLL